MLAYISQVGGVNEVRNASPRGIKIDIAFPNSQVRLQGEILNNYLFKKLTQPPGAQQFEVQGIRAIDIEYIHRSPKF